MSRTMQGIVISLLIGLVVGLINWLTTSMFVVGVISFAIVSTCIVGPMVHLCRSIK
jgi:hypothetical protein